MEKLTQLAIELSVYVVALTQMWKEMGIPSKLLPVFAIMMGALVNMAFNDFSLAGAIQGAIVGALTTCGVAFVDDRLKKVSKDVPPL